MYVNLGQVTVVRHTLFWLFVQVFKSAWPVVWLKWWNVGHAFLSQTANGKMDITPGTRWGVGRRFWDSVGRRASLLGLGGASGVAP